MEISLKVQNIGANYNPEAKDIVITHEFDVPTEQLLAKRGRLYITLKISANGDFDLKDAASIFLDSVQENFYRLTEETPLHSLEKALNRATKLVLTIKSRDESISLSSIEANFKLTFATALVWNRVLYTSYLGAPAVYLVRGTGVRNLSMNQAANEIWTNSGILDNQDVIILGTDKFAKVFPSNEIANSLGNISQTIANHADKDELAALLIKVTTSEKQSTGNPAKSYNSRLRDTIYASFWKLKNRFTENEKLSDRFKFYQNKKTAPVSSISGLPTPAASTAAVNMTKSPKRVSPSKNSKKNKRRVAIGLAMLMILTLSAYRIIGPAQTPIANDINANISLHEVPQVMGTATENKLGEQTTQTPELHPVFIDLNTLGGNPTITGLSTTLDSTLVLDATGRKLYTINPETKEAKSIFENFEESSLPQFLECDITFCYVGDSNKFYVIKPDSPEKVDDYLPGVEGTVDLYPYSPANAVYLLTDNQIYSYPIGSTNTATTEAKEWLAPDQTLNDARSMIIDNGVIFVATNNEIIKFSNKRRVTAFAPDPAKAANATTLQVSGNRLYALNVIEDKKVIHVFDKNSGEFIETIELSMDSPNPKLFTFPKYAKGKLLFEKNEVLHEVTLN